MRKKALALLVVALNEFAAPVGLALFGAWLLHGPTGLWLGLAIAPAVGFALCMLATRDVWEGELSLAGSQ